MDDLTDLDVELARLTVTLEDERYAVPREPRHRARRHVWKPPLEPAEAQHLHYSDTFVR